MTLKPSRPRKKAAPKADADLQKPLLLIVGQSHTDAVKKVLLTEPADDIVVINFNLVSDPIYEKGRFDPRMVADFAPTHLISMAGGNYHNVFGLIENPVRFNFMEADDRSEDVDAERLNIPYALMYDFFNTGMREGFLQTLLEIRNCFNVPTCHVCSPPPYPDSQHIIDNPGNYFSNKIHLGVSPPALRRKLYDVHTRVYREFCAENGITFIPPPRKAVDKDGFLRSPYWRNDPTHANHKYGKLVLGQIRELVGRTS
ncbi:MAG: hypothetical protein WDN06_14345 [Asticcacaulis sp.]